MREGFVNEDYQVKGLLTKELCSGVDQQHVVCALDAGCTSVNSFCQAVHGVRVEN